VDETGAPLYLSAARLDALELSARDVVASIEHVIRGQARSEVWNAPKAVILPPDGRYVMGTLAAADDPPYMVMKSLIVNPGKARPGVPDINASVTLSDSTTGVPLAVLDGNWITAVRTAGLSAVAATRLARTDAERMAFVGCGVQAHSHLSLFKALFPLTEIRAFGRGQVNRDALCSAASALGLAAVKSATAEEALAGADIVVTSVTLSPDVKPFLDGHWLAPGAFAAITDLARPWAPGGMSAFDRIFIDDLEQERKSEKPMVPVESIDGDLSGLVQGSASGRATPDERTAFIFRGLALGDLALAALAYDRATEARRGGSR
jgi:ornithine cyclodeaminase/alanine dehydrogenase-like protein (mu-crystallin family)